MNRFWAPLCKLNSWMETCLSPHHCLALVVVFGSEVYQTATTPNNNQKQSGVTRCRCIVPDCSCRWLHPSCFKDVCPNAARTSCTKSRHQEIRLSTQCSVKSNAPTNSSNSGTHTNVHPQTATAEGYKPLHALTLPLHPCPGAGSTRIQA